MRRFVCLYAIAIAVTLPAYAQLPSHRGYPAAPDEWLVNSGQPWHHKISTELNPVSLTMRTPVGEEARVIDSAQELFRASSAKAIVLLDGRQIVWKATKSPITDSNLLFGFSMGKTVTAMAVGRAICASHLRLETKVADVVPELGPSDLGKATVKDLLTMTSGAWAGNPDSTIWSPTQASAIASGQMNWLELLQTRKVSSAETVLGQPFQPGEKFMYRSTDPLTLGVMLARATGTSYARWIESEVLKPAGIEGPAAVAQDRAAQWGQADGGIRMKLADWVRFAVWVYESGQQPGCFGDFVRDSASPHAPTARPGSLPQTYGYLTWVSGDVSWAVGHGGQRIAWNKRNSRMMVTFSSVEDYMPKLHSLYEQWAAVKGGQN